MGHRIAKVLLALSVVGLVVVAGVATRADATPTKKTPSFELRVGDVMSFTGDLSAYGPSLDAAVKLGVDVIKTRRGLGYGLEAP